MPDENDTQNPTKKEDKQKPTKVESIVKRLYAEVVGDKDKGKIDKANENIKKLQGEKRVLQDKLKSATSGTKVRSELVNISASVTKAKSDGKSLSDMKSLRKLIKKFAISDADLNRSEVAKLFKIAGEVLIEMPKPVKEAKPEKESSQKEMAQTA